MLHLRTLLWIFCIAATFSATVGILPVQAQTFRFEDLSEEQKDTLQRRALKARNLLSDYSQEYKTTIGPPALKIKQKAMDDPKVSQRVLVWLLGTVPFVNSLQFSPNPFVATVDLLSFTEKLEQFFNAPEQKNYFGKSTPIAREAVQKANKSAWGYARKIFTEGEYARVRTEVIGSAAKDPLKALFAIPKMKGYSAERAHNLARSAEGGMIFGMMDDSINDTLGRLASIDLQVQHLNDNLEFLPGVIRFNTMLFIYEWLESPQIAQALNDAQIGLSALSDLEQTLSALPPEKIEQVLEDVEQGSEGLIKLGKVSDEVIELIALVKAWLIPGAIALLLLFLLVTVTVIRLLTERREHLAVPSKPTEPVSEESTSLEMKQAANL